MNRWSSRHRWRARSEAWDAYLSSQYRAELVDAQRSLAHRHSRISRVALEKVAAAVESVDVAGLTVAEMVRLWDIATRTEREALQLLTRLEMSSPSGTLTHIKNMSDEERVERMVALRRELDERLRGREAWMPTTGTSDPSEPKSVHPTAVQHAVSDGSSGGEEEGDQGEYRQHEQHHGVPWSGRYLSGMGDGPSAGIGDPNTCLMSSADGGVGMTGGAEWDADTRSLIGPHAPRLLLPPAM